MAAGTQPIFAQVIINPTVQFLPADGTAYKTMRIASANGDRIDSIIATSNDTTAHTLMFAINDGVTDHPIGEVVIPATAGSDGTATIKGVSVLNTSNFPGIGTSGSMFLAFGSTLKVRTEVVIAATKQIDLFGFGGAY